ncbi:XAC0095 family protein [Xanthomonas campestris]|uniref:XAC0095 family protein n=1 Tax=Xanthomonas campestris TaxID=339 RepID=UPI00137AAC7C|nr:hypothetical protein [Xanthomonas campestris]
MHNEPGYWMSEGTQYHLLRVRDQLRLLATLATPRTRDEAMLGTLTIPLQQWAHCLQNLAEQVDEVINDLGSTS